MQVGDISMGDTDKQHPRMGVLVGQDLLSPVM